MLGRPSQTNLNQTTSGIDLLDNKRREQRMTGNVVIPNSMNIRNERKIYTDDELEQIVGQEKRTSVDRRMIEDRRMGIDRREQVQMNQNRQELEFNEIEQTKINNQNTEGVLPGLLDFDDIELPENNIQKTGDEATLPGLLDFDDIELPKNNPQKTNTETILPGLEDIQLPSSPIIEPSQLQMEAISNSPEIKQEPKCGRGRPRKNPVVVESPKPKGKRGRPRKNPLPEDKIEEIPKNNIEPVNPQVIDTLPGLEDFENVLNEPTIEVPEETIKNIVPNIPQTLNDDILPGLENINQTIPDIEENIEYEAEEDDDDILSGLPGLEDENIIQPVVERPTTYTPSYIPEVPQVKPSEPQVSSYSPRQERIETIRKLEENKVYSTRKFKYSINKR